MTTTWVGGVEVVAAVVLATGGAGPEAQAEAEGWVASEREPPVEERRTSGNHLKVLGWFDSVVIVLISNLAIIGY